MSNARAAVVALLFPLALTAAFAAKAFGSNAVNPAPLQALAEREAARGEPGAKAMLAAIKEGAKAKPDAETTVAIGNWVNDAARRGEPEAQFQIASHAERIKRDPVLAAEWYLKAANQGFAPAQVGIAGLYLFGSGVPKDADKALAWCQKAVAQNYSYAQFMLGYMYAKGSGVPKDLAKGAEWYEKAASQGNTDAQFYLAVAYLQGEGVPPNQAKGEYWMKKAAEAGAPEAKLAMSMSAGGRQVMAAQAGDAQAQFVLGTKLLLGAGGLAKKPDEAFKWLTKAAEQGHAGAQANLAHMYAKGIGVARSDKEALRLLRSAAEKGNPEAQTNLGLWYEKGFGGVPKDQAMAVSLYRKASAQGNKIAAEQLKRLGKLEGS